MRCKGTWVNLGRASGSCTPPSPANLAMLCSQVCLKGSFPPAGRPQAALLQPRPSQCLNLRRPLAVSHGFVGLPSFPLRPSFVCFEFVFSYVVATAQAGLFIQSSFKGWVESTEACSTTASCGSLRMWSFQRSCWPHTFQIGVHPLNGHRLIANTAMIGDEPGLPQVGQATREPGWEGGSTGTDLMVRE